MSVKNASWTLDRTYPFPPAAVFAAWADPALKRRWFVGPDDAGVRYESEFRVGRQEQVATAPTASPSYTYSGVYRDIVADERIVSTSEMTLDGQRISVTVSTAEFLAVDAGTRLVLTEQGAWLDELDQPQWREQGIGTQLDRLETELRS